MRGGLELSTSVSAVLSSNLAWPTIFLKQRFVDLTIHSNDPSHQGAFSRLIIHSTSS